MPKSCQNGNESTFWQNKWQLVHIQTQERERETDPYTHEHIIILSIHTCMSIIDTLHIHTHMTIDPLHTHIMSIDHLHTYEHIIHIHMNTSLHGQLTEMRDRSRERWKGEVRASTGEGDERPETSSITYVTSKASFTC